MLGCSSTGADSFRDGLDDTDDLSSERHLGATRPAGVKPELPSSVPRCLTGPHLPPSAGGLRPAPTPFDCGGPAQLCRVTFVSVSPGVSLTHPGRRCPTLPTTSCPKHRENADVLIGGLFAPPSGMSPKIRSSRRRLRLVIWALCVWAAGASANAAAATVFNFDSISDPSLSSLPASFAQDGLTMAVTATGEKKTFRQTDSFSGLFPHVFGGALTDGFLLTQFPGIPPSTLTLAFSADIVAFSADFGMLVDFGVVADPTPASLRLEAFAGSQQLGSLVVTPTGGPSVYEGVVSFAHPTSEPFDRVVLTSLPAAFNAGSPEFILDNVRVTQIPEPPVLMLGVVGLVVLTLLGARYSGRT